MGDRGHKMPQVHKDEFNSVQFGMVWHGHAFLRNRLLPSDSSRTNASESLRAWHLREFRCGIVSALQGVAWLSRVILSLKVFVNG